MVGQLYGTLKQIMSRIGSNTGKIKIIYYDVLNKHGINTTTIKFKNKPAVFTEPNTYCYLARSSDTSSFCNEINPFEFFRRDDLLNLNPARLTPNIISSLAFKSIEGHGRNNLVKVNKSLLTYFSVWVPMKAFGASGSGGGDDDSKKKDKEVDEQLASEKTTETVNDTINKAADQSSSLNLNPVTPVPRVKGADLENNKLDLFRSFISSIIAEFSGKSADDILGLLDVPKNPEHGDVAIAIPRLRIQGNPAEIAQQWAKKVFTIISLKYIIGIV